MITLDKRIRDLRTVIDQAKKSARRPELVSEDSIHTDSLSEDLAEYEEYSEVSPQSPYTTEQPTN